MVSLSLRIFTFISFFAIFRFPHVFPALFPLSGSTSCVSEPPLARRSHLLLVGATACFSEPPLAFRSHLLLFGVISCFSEPPLAFRSHLIHFGVPFFLKNRWRHFSEIAYFFRLWLFFAAVTCFPAFFRLFPLFSAFFPNFAFFRAGLFFSAFLGLRDFTAAFFFGRKSLKCPGICSVLYLLSPSAPTG